MHDLLREMAKLIISEKFPRHPGKWSRLWNHQEVTKVLGDNSGTEEVEGLALYCPPPWETEEVELAPDSVQKHSSKSSCFSTEGFANMKKLRLLQLCKVQLNGEYKHLSKELVWLSWSGCPLKSIPDDFFDQPRLVSLEITSGKLVQVWEGSKSLENLKFLDLRSCLDLKKSPDFSNLPNLEELMLEWCVSLFEIHPSIGHLKKLSLVNLTGCKNLISLPGDFYKSKSVQTLVLDECCQFSELPEDIGKMLSLRVLKASFTAIRQVPRSTVRLMNLTHLSLAGVGSEFPLRFPDSLHGLDSLRNLDLSNNDFDTLPSLSGLSKLESLRLSDCHHLHTLPSLSGLSKLESLQLSNCHHLHTLPSLSGLSKLESLQLSNCHHLHTLPSLSDLSKLESLWLHDCFELRTIYDLPTNLKFLDAPNCLHLVTMPNFSKMSNMRELVVCNSYALTEVPDLDKSLYSMTWIDMRDCPKLTADFRRNVLKGWTSCGYGGIFLNGNYVPDWFEFVNNGDKVSFDIPPSDGRNFEGLTLLCFYSSDLHQSSSHIRCKVAHPHASIDINNTKRNELRTCIGKEDWVIKMRDVVYKECFLWQGQISNDKLNLQSGDKVDITFEMPEMDYKNYYATIQGTGVNLVWDKPMKENIHDFDRDGWFLIQRHNQGGDA